MKKVLALLGILVLACLTTAGRAQDKFEGGPHKGAKEISLLGNLSFGGSGDGVNGHVAGSIGYYLSDRFEIGPVASIQFSSGGGGGTTTTGTIGGFTKYRLKLGRTSPYLGLDFLTSVGGGTSVQFIAPAIGVDFFLHPQQSIFVEYQLQAVVSGGSSDTQHNINFGLRFFLK
jgi:hypothetical protein